MALASLGCNCGGECGGKVGLSGLGDFSDYFSGFGADAIPSTDPLLPVTPSFAITAGEAPAISLPGSGGYAGGNYLADIASLFPTGTVTANTSGSGVSSSINWNAILQNWTSAGTQIAKAAAGANPTYQSYNPATGQTTTVYGNPANLPSNLLPSSIGGMSLTTILLIGAGLLVAMKMAGK